MFVCSKFLSTTLLLLIPFGSCAAGLKGRVVNDKNLMSSSNQNKNLTSAISNDNDHSLVGDYPRWCNNVPDCSVQVCHGDDPGNQQQCWGEAVSHLNGIAFQNSIQFLRMTFEYGIDCHTECQPFAISHLGMDVYYNHGDKWWDSGIMIDAGRQKSKGPAMCFISGLDAMNVLGTCDPIDTTPEELNFSVNLDLTFLDSQGEPVFYLPDFHIGQGSNSDCNNWWIGHRGCHRQDDGSLHCQNFLPWSPIREFTFKAQDSDRFHYWW